MAVVAKGNLRNKRDGWAHHAAKGLHLNALRNLKRASDGPAYDNVPLPVETCAGPAGHIGERSDIPVATSDLYGQAGFAEKPDAWASSASQRQGFGGTSAASAIVTGLIARLAERDEAEEHSWGIKARKLLTDGSEGTGIAFVAADQSEGWINFSNAP